VLRSPRIHHTRITLVLSSRASEAFFFATRDLLLIVLDSRQRTASAVVLKRPIPQGL
jgi:hypothetical protein